MPGKEVLIFCCAGPKNYYIKTREKIKDGSYVIKDVIKLRGIYLGTASASKQLTGDVYEKFMREYITNVKVCHTVISQWEIRSERISKRVYTTLGLKTFRNNVFDKRVKLLKMQIID